MKQFCALPVLLLLSACSGGGGSSAGRQDADPVVVDYPVVFVRRALSFEDDGLLREDNIYAPATFNAGAQLVLKERATPGAPERVLTGELFDGDYDVKDLNVSADGGKLVFAMRAPEEEDADEQPTWNIWVYDREEGSLQRVIRQDLIAEEGEDIAPAFLPDGRIVFSSTRQRRSRALLLDDNKPQFSALAEDLRNEAFVLHVMDADGSNIRQISFNQSHDLHPAVLADGRILFNRWDRMGGANSLSLYTVRPDGSALEVHYGYHSQNTGSNQSEAVFARPQPLPDGRLLAVLRAPRGAGYGGDLLAIDSISYAEAYSEPEGGGQLQGQESVSLLPVVTDGGISPHGLFASAWPLHDGSSRLLVAWSECRLLEPDTGLARPCSGELLEDPDVEPADPLYGLWVYDYRAGTQRPIVVAVEGEMISEAVAMEPRPLPDFLPDPVPGMDLDEGLVQAGVGILDIRSVYSFDGEAIADIDQLADPLIAGADMRPARFLRVEKAVAIPDDEVLDFDNNAFGRSRGQLMREILGYTPIQPDGSVRVQIPADMPFALSVVDADGRRLGGRHQNWLQLRPGEQRQCAGCHTGDSEVPHGRADLEPASAWAGSPTSGIPFPNTEPALVAEMGETMAQLLARIAGEAALTGDLVYADLWTDPALREKDPSSALRYADLATPQPVSLSCQDEWVPGCRSVIHYPEHIQPIWERTRELLDDSGALIEDRSCLSCHTPRDESGLVRLPAGQLNLVSELSPNNASWMTSYVQLLFARPTQEIVDGTLSNILVQDTDDNGNPLFETDEEGNLILDANGDPIPVMVTVNRNRLMDEAAANNSRFFQSFRPGRSHADYLEPAELRLVSEWLDIGAQYYNNPFDAPVN